MTWQSLLATTVAGFGFLVGTGCGETAQSSVPGKGMVVNDLEISGPQNGPAEVVVKSGDAGYSVGVREDGVFAIADADRHPFLSVQEGNVFAHTQVLSAGGLASAGNLAVGEVFQWALVAAEDYAEGASGWGERCVLLCPGGPSASGDDGKCLAGSVSPCGGVRMLGGFGAFAGGQTHKTFKVERPHTAVRVTGTFHFIDEWEGETGFMMLGTAIKGRGCDDMSYQWTHSYDSREITSAVNVCGRPEVGEGRFAVPFDVVIPHMAAELEVVFGSTLKTTGEFRKHGNAWWGVSGLEVYIR